MMSSTTACGAAFRTIGRATERETVPANNGLQPTAAGGVAQSVPVAAAAEAGRWAADSSRRESFGAHPPESSVDAACWHNWVTTSAISQTQR
jgi:hypothetical protein